MDKRKFLKQLGLGAATLIALPNLTTSCISNKKEAFKYWMWIGGGVDKPKTEWTEQLSRLKELGFYGVLAGGGKNTLKTAIPIAKSLGLEIHAWLWTMNRPGDKEAQAHPEWYAISREGNSSFNVRPYVEYYQWLCPSKPEVREWITKGMLEICDLEGLDGIQLDYVRYCDVILPRGLWKKYKLIQDHEIPQFDFCYCDTCRKNFKAKQGYDPLKLEDPSTDELWKQFRYNEITSLVNNIAKEVHKRNKKISASVFASPTLARQLVRQDWDKWNLDFVFPMIYYKFYDKPVDFVKTATEEGIKALNGARPLYTAQYLYDKTNKALEQAIEAAKAGGAQGIAFFDYGLLDEEKAKVISMSMV